MVHPPLKAWPGWKENFSTAKYGPIKEMHNYAQMLQTIQILKGEKTLPRALLPSCHVAPELGPVEGADTFADVDVVLVEVSTAVELIYRGHQLHKFGLNQKLLKPHFNKSTEQTDAIDLWLQKGLTEFDEDARERGAEALLGTVTGDLWRDNFIRSLARELRSARCDVLGDLGKIKAIFPCPVGVVLKHFMYLPHGRSISWPPRFVTEIQAAARTLDMPVFDPAPLVHQAGPEIAIGGKDGVHYNRDFMPTIGAAITDFALSIAR
jgi:hypothetical protein